MLRTNNKRLHSNLWTIAHFAGSALVFLLVVASCCYFTFVAHGAYTSAQNFNTSPTWVVSSFSSVPMALMPVTSLMKVVFNFDFTTTNDFFKAVIAFSVGLDLALWFNVGLWTLQLILFVPDACFHWLERKKED